MRACKNVISVFVFLVLSYTVSAQDSGLPTPDSRLIWTEVAAGVWKGIAGTPETYDLLKAAGSLPNKEALSRMGTIAFPLSRNIRIDPKI